MFIFTESRTASVRTVYLHRQHHCAEKQVGEQTSEIWLHWLNETHSHSLVLIRTSIKDIINVSQKSLIDHPCVEPYWVSTLVNWYFPPKTKPGWKALQLWPTLIKQKSCGKEPWVRTNLPELLDNKCAFSCLPSQRWRSLRKKICKAKVVMNNLTFLRKKKKSLRLMTFAATLMALKTGKHQIQWQQTEKESIPPVSLHYRRV